MYAKIIKIYGPAMLVGSYLKDEQVNHIITIISSSFHHPGVGVGVEQIPATLIIQLLFRILTLHSHVLLSSHHGGWVETLRGRDITITSHSGVIFNETLTTLYQLQSTKISV